MNEETSSRCRKNGLSEYSLIVGKTGAESLFGSSKIFLSRGVDLQTVAKALRTAPFRLCVGSGFTLAVDSQANFGCLW